LTWIVADRTDHPTLGWRGTNNHWFATQIRIIPLLYGSVESVHVEMEDDPKHREARLPRTFEIQMVVGDGFEPSKA
jgi:hypothetical protein